MPVTRYNFTQETTGPQHINHEVLAENLDELLGYFEDFLRGCGYNFEGHISIEQEDE